MGLQQPIPFQSIVQGPLRIHAIYGFEAHIEARLSISAMSLSGPRNHAPGLGLVTKKLGGD